VKALRRTAGGASFFLRNGVQRIFSANHRRNSALAAGALYGIRAWR